MTTTTQDIQTLEKHIWIWRDYKIQYTVMGTGQPLVLIHGFGASIGHWRKNIPVLAEAGYQVFAVDLLGFGGSDKAVIDYSLELWAELLKDFYNAHIQTPAIFIGNSIGALLSLIVLTEYPEIAAGGVLINSAGGLSHRPHELNPILRVVMGTFNKLVANPVTGKFVFNRIRQKSQIRRTLYQVYSDRNAVTDELVDLLYNPSSDPGAQEVFASILTAPPGPSPEELLPKLEFPLLVIWGAEDPWTPITGANIYEAARENGQDIKIVPIPGAGHCPHDEVPDIVNSEIIDWLGEVINN
ncbi:alpha/beta fold hydrolase [Dolichospermum sp. ST_sed1]|nr:alpha/beta fold hydrolase [Dolichospermum sp. ST_sed1]MDD1426290.1 alpha/beta fold hydrolase [Dolichospermum sp. ST_sed9]MDD1433293.1 alpha/beta fold hydrolase [Dolichospermum sp. ST_sed6]MDD1436417.1 alpha/beta fold hydrolase [Dolichospermum sp. ST_sed10]MDD1442175.1 alpha/beta fold hydrolase [Dolichospermum sp. ST_sed3]MDD1444578.1 alpha/beta fold hydrolase [Dolichospermum sp. ST_sed8]MDD1456634.1 alpha/beta fold hydrolase [Dolichospermum sp. ST_sed7]MDD1460110.1 alpha/beta fold hydrola